MLAETLQGARLDVSADRTAGPVDIAADEIVSGLYALHAGALVAFGRRLGLDDDEAWDVVAEAHLRLWRALAAGQSIHDGRAWLATTTYRLAMDRHRLTRRVAELRRRLGFGLGLRATHDGAADSTDALAAWTAVDALPMRQRAAIYLHYRLDLPYEDVGRAMGITTGAARVAGSRGLATVRAALGVVDGAGAVDPGAEVAEAADVEGAGA